MNQFQRQLNEIKPSERLVEETMRRMHEENAKLREEADGDPALRGRAAGIAAARWKRLRVGLAAAAACAVLLATGALLAGGLFTPVATLRADTQLPAVTAAGKGFLNAGEETLSLDAFNGRTGGLDFETLVPGYDCVSAEAVAFVDDAGNILGDYGVFTYQSGVKRVLLYASTTDQTAPAELLGAESVTVNGTEVRIGRIASGKAYYGAWIQGGASICIKSDSLGRRAFWKLVQSITA